MAPVPTQRILKALAERYPEARCALYYNNPFELLVATVLAAQCTDNVVNTVTPGLFAKYPTPEAMAGADLVELEEAIKRVGLYKNKAKNLLAAARILTEQHGGVVPAEREALEALPGVGRKTANVVLSNAFDIPAFAVDTHVFRVTNRLGLAQADNVLETERQVTRRIPKKLWTQAHHWLIFHGRQVCHARNPKCEACPLNSLCQEYKKTSPKKNKKTS